MGGVGDWDFQLSVSHTFGTSDWTWLERSMRVGRALELPFTAIASSSALDDAHKASGPVRKKSKCDPPPNCTDKSKVECFVAVMHRIDVCVRAFHGANAIGGKGVERGSDGAPHSLATG